MTLLELREHVMFQTNNDEDDLEEFQPSVDRYLNEGYDKLVEAYADAHVNATIDGEIPYPALANDADVPLLPWWAHRAIGDYGAYMVYRNGNQYKQNRGERYLQMFYEVLNKLRLYKVDENGRKAKRHFYNLYTD